jgi:hypothetical protein
VRKCQVDRDTVLNGVNPTLVPKAEAAPRPTRVKRERSA